jgi:protein-disulfide isomerase
MFDRAMLRVWAMFVLGLLAACGSQPSSASHAPTATEPTRAPVVPTAAAVSAPTAAVSRATAAAPTAGATEPAANGAIPESLTPEGYHVLGRPDAPVTLVMYSDFL